MSQSLSCIWVHIIFSTKKRIPYLKNIQIRKKLYQYIIGTSNALNTKVCRINGMTDHIHLLVNLSRTITISDYVKKIKNGSSKWIKNLSDQSDYLSEFHWQSGYAAFSVSESNIEFVKNYIINQELHHEKFDYSVELKKILEAHHIKYNQIYLDE